MATSQITWPFNVISITGTGVDASSFATASTSPTNGRVQYAGFFSQLASGADPQTVTASGTNGFSGTWTSVATVACNDGSAKGWRLTLFRSTATSGTAGVITFTLGASEVQTGACWGVIECTNVVETPQQSGTASNAASGAALGVTLGSALTDSRNTVIGLFGCGVSGVSNAPAAGQLSQISTASTWLGGDGANISMMWQMSPTITSTPGYGTRIGRCSIAFELANSNAASGNVPRVVSSGNYEV